MSAKKFVMIEENDIGDGVVPQDCRVTRQPASTRWTPTPEQLMLLEDMYTSGIRNPTGEQIQQFTAHLSLYGKIEGRNLFYWFQNRKARDRLKLRLQNMDAALKRTLGTFHEDQLSDIENGRKFATEECSSKSRKSCGSVEKRDWYADYTADAMTPATVRPLETPAEKLQSVSLCGSVEDDWAEVDIASDMTSRTRPVQTLELFPLSPGL